MKLSRSLSIVAATFLVWGCTPSTPQPQTQTTLATTPDGSVVLEEHNVTTPDANQTDTQRYKISFEAPPLAAPFNPENINKKQPTYTQPPVAEVPIVPISIRDTRPVRLSVEKIPVGKFAEVALGSVLKLNYVITPDAAAKTVAVSLNMSASMKAEDFLAIAQKIMNDNGLILSREAGSTVFVTAKQPKVAPSYNPNSQDMTIYYGRELPQNIPDSKQITMFIPYYYVDMMQQFGQIKNLSLSPNAMFQIMDDKKVVMVKDVAGNIKKALTYLDLFDRPMMKNKSVKIIPLHYVTAKNFATRVREILPTVGVPVAKKTSDLGIYIQELPELKSLLVLSDKSEWIDQLLYWRDKIDTTSALGDAPQMFVYQVKNRKAAELVTLATGVTGPSKTTEETQTQSTSSNTKQPSSAASSVSSLFAQTKIVADTNTNSLIIYATPERYTEIEKVLQTIDTLPRQVMVEVTIAELTLTDKLSYGLEWYLKNSGSQYSGSLQTMGNLGLGSGGLTGSILKNTADFSAMINMFAQKNLISILSSPKIVVLDNQSATINVGTEVPVLSSQTTASIVGTASTSTQQSVQYRTTGIILSVKPTVNSNGILTLAINQSVSEAQQNSLSSISSPLILNRSIDTNVVLRSGESVVLGGLISTNKSDGNTRVPFFGDLPLLGNLFKTTSTSTTKTELIVLVKPVILESNEQYVTLSKAMGKISE